MNKPKCIVVCVDDTMLDTRERKQKRKSFITDEKELINYLLDRPFLPVVTMIKLFEQSGNYDFCFISDRPNIALDITNNQVSLCYNGSFSLSLRARGDEREAWEVKETLVTELQKEYDIFLIVDSDVDSINNWESLGLPYIDINQDDYLDF